MQEYMNKPLAQFFLFLLQSVLFVCIAYSSVTKTINIHTQKHILFIAITLVYALMTVMMLSTFYIQKVRDKRLAILFTFLAWVFLGLLFSINYLPSFLLWFYLAFWLLVIISASNLWESMRPQKKGEFDLLYYKILLCFIITCFVVFTLSTISKYKEFPLVQLFNMVSVWSIFLVFLGLFSFRGILAGIEVKAGLLNYHRYEKLFTEHQRRKKSITDINSLSASIEEVSFLFASWQAGSIDMIEFYGKYVLRFLRAFIAAFIDTFYWFLQDVRNIARLLFISILLPLFSCFNRELALNLYNYINFPQWSEVVSSWSSFATQESQDIIFGESFMLFLWVVIFAIASVLLFVWLLHLSSKTYQLPQAKRNEAFQKTHIPSIMIIASFCFTCLLLPFCSFIWSELIVYRYIGWGTVLALLPLTVHFIRTQIKKRTLPK